MVYLISRNEAMTTDSQRYNCCEKNGANVIPKHAFPVDKGSNPIIGLTLLGDRNSFRENSKYCEISH